MQFKQTLLVAALAAVAKAQVSAQQVVENVDQITELSSQTNNIAQSISITNLFTTAPQLIDNFRQIVEIASQDVTSMSKRQVDKRQDCLNVEDPEKCVEDLGEILQDPSEVLGEKRSVFSSAGSGAARALQARQAAPPYDDVNQQAICDSFRGFVQIHQQLLSTVIGKHGLLSQTPFTAPIGQVLRVLEGGVDTLAFNIIDDVPTCADDATNNKNDLDATLTDAVDTYNS